MNHYLVTWVLVLLISVTTISRSSAEENPSTKQLSPSASALAFLKTLSNSKKNKAQYHLENASRMKWDYFPDMRTRNGIRLKDMKPNEKQAALAVVQAVLSAAGYLKVTQVIALEDVLKSLEGWNLRDPERYYLAIYGEPSNTHTWAIQFEGHHLSLNFVLKGNQIVAAAPRFFGANPSRHTGPDKSIVETLKLEESLGRELLLSLKKKQLLKAIVSNDAPADILTRSNSYAEALLPKGLPVSEMSTAQQKIFWQLLAVYLDPLPIAIANKRLTLIKNTEPTSLFFAWAGSSQKGQPHYYRIQSSDFLIEYDNTQNNANHVHTVWRDLTNDFGRDYLREHYHAHHR